MMIHAVITFFKERKVIEGKLKQLDVAIKQLISLELQLQEKESKFHVKINGVTLDRHKHRNVLIELALVISGGMGAFAEKHNKKHMLKEFNYPFSKLNRANDTTLVGLCYALLNEARKIKKLCEFGVDKTRLLKLEEQIRLFKKKAPLYGIAKRKQAAAHAEMKKLINEMCRLLKYRIDKMMRTMKEEKECEYDLYTFQRSVVCYGRKRKARLKKVIDKLTGEVLSDVKVDIIEQAEKIVTEFINDEQEQAELFKATIRIEKKGYKPLVIESADLRMLELIEASLEREEDEEKIKLKIDNEQLILNNEPKIFPTEQNMKKRAGMYE